MKHNPVAPIVSAILILTFVSLACSSSAATPVPVTDTPAATATKTPKPTSTPRPSPTPNLAATQRTDEFNAFLQTLNEKGYVNSTDGKVVELDPFKEEWAQINWYQWWPYEGDVSDFVFRAHFKWSTASATPDESGCGVIFGMQDNEDHYAVFLDKSRILFLMGRGTYVYNVGKTRGSGRVNFGIPAEADFALSVKGQNAYVSVDDEFTEYTLSADQTSTGVFALTVLSGTNKDYGTRCEMTDLMFWTPK